MTRSARSCPVQKARPAPVRIRARAPSGTDAPDGLAQFARALPQLKLFSLSGRFSVMRATPSRNA
jgi:hypothetical protein